MTRVLIGAPVREDHTTFYKYLKHLNQLDTDSIKVDYFFILHNSPRLKRFLKPNQYIEYQSENEYVKDTTHHWTNNNLHDVAQMKNYLLEYVQEKNYDFFFLVDSDLLLQPDTLKRLLSHQKPIVAQCFWTRWKPEQTEQPNAWMADFYSFYSLEQFEKWHDPQLVQVGGTGACILIHRSVIDSAVSYNPIYNVSFSNWEDRAFCIRAAVAGFEIWLDTTSPPIHLYQRNKKKQDHENKSGVGGRYKT